MSGEPTADDLEVMYRLDQHVREHKLWLEVEASHERLTRIRVTDPQAHRKSIVMAVINGAGLYDAARRVLARLEAARP